MSIFYQENAENFEILWVLSLKTQNWTKSQFFLGHPVDSNETSLSYRMYNPNHLPWIINQTLPLNLLAVSILYKLLIIFLLPANSQVRYKLSYQASILF